MTTDRQKVSAQQRTNRFRESFDDYCAGHTGLEHMHTIIAELLDGEPGAAGGIIATLDTAFRQGRIKARTYDALTSDVDRATSEDEPTEWSEEAREQFGGENPSSDTGVPAPEDTGYPAANLSTSDASTLHSIDIGPGTVLKNRFELTAHIGAGSMADVYEAIDHRLHEAGSSNPRLAIKVISAAFSTHPDALKTLQREALNGQALVHPNVIRVFDFDRDNDLFFMTMELLEGRSLVGILDERRSAPLPFTQARSILEGVCAGLRYAHDHGVIHADIKPGNIFVPVTGRAKVLDFGIARIAPSAFGTDDAALGGAHTPAYASCEVLEGADPTVQDDIFSMACVAYRMLAGRRAFGNLTAVDAERKHRKPRRIETLNRKQWHALEQALAFRHTDRTANIGTFADAFFDTSAIVQVTDKRRYDRESHRLPLRYGVPAIAAVLFAIALVLFWPQPDLVEPPVVKNEPIVPESPRATTIFSDSPDINPLQLVITEEDRPAVVPKTSSSPGKLPAATEPAPEIAPEVPRPDPVKIRIAELATLADSAMNDGRLTAPADDNARLFITEMIELAPEAVDAQQRRTRLADLLLLEAMVAITDENFDAATRWIEETNALGVPAETTQRFEVELQKARDARSARQAESIGAIFASATPAAILANPGILFSDDQVIDAATAGRSADQKTTADAERTGPVTGPGSLSLAMVLPGAMPEVAPESVPDDPPGETADTTSRDVPLSTLEFRRFSEPKLPRHLAARKVSGWVEVRFRVTRQGRTENITVIAAEPENLFEKTAVTAIAKWRFEPVYVDGVAIENHSSVRLRFEP